MLEDRPMTIIEHLEELRMRILLALTGVAIGTVLVFIFSNRILELLLRPAGTTKLIALTVLEPFLTRLKVSLIMGIGLAMPWILYQTFMFIRPALTREERRVANVVVVLLGVLFYTGAAFGYRFIVPSATRWLLAQAGEMIEVRLTALNYVGYITWFLVGVGLAFETPILILSLTWLGIVNPAQLRREWRVAYMTILVLAAMLTPDWSPITMFFVAVPMIFLYELSILLSRWLIRPRRAPAETKPIEPT